VDVNRGAVKTLPTTNWPAVPADNVATRRDSVPSTGAPVAPYAFLGSHVRRASSRCLHQWSWRRTCCSHAGWTHSFGFSLYWRIDA